MPLTPLTTIFSPKIANLRNSTRREIVRWTSSVNLRHIPEQPWVKNANRLFWWPRITPVRTPNCWKKTVAWSSRWNKTWWQEEARMAKLLMRSIVRVSSIVQPEMEEESKADSKGWPSDYLLSIIIELLSELDPIIPPSYFISDRRLNRSTCPWMICRHTFASPN